MKREADKFMSAQRIYDKKRNHDRRSINKMSDKILVTRSSMPPIDEYIDEIRGLWETHCV